MNVTAVVPKLVLIPNFATMPTDTHIPQLLSQIENSLNDNSFVKLSLGNYKGTEEGLKNIYVKRVVIKKEEKLSFTYRYKTRDIVKNYSTAEALQHIGSTLDTGFNFAGLFTTTADWTWERDNKGKTTWKQLPATHNEAPSPEHDRTKVRLIAAQEKPYLQALNITGADGKVYNNAQDKYKQINHFVQIVSSLIKDLDVNELHKVADMGSGKGYLTFALYDYLSNVLKLDIRMTGVEFRKDMVALCNSIAQQTGFKGLNFTEGTIEQFDSTGTDILIALHACDTATDDAIWKGINAGAKLIMVAPCCHKQVRREMDAHKAKNELAFLTKYGIFMERQAEMVTDGIRALILEYFGYSTKVFDFIADAHTPKNVMIVGVKREKATANQQEIKDKLRETKSYFGIGYHHLERLAGLE